MRDLRQKFCHVDYRHFPLVLSSSRTAGEYLYTTGTVDVLVLTLNDAINLTEALILSNLGYFLWRSDWSDLHCFADQSKANIGSSIKSCPIKLKTKCKKK